MEENGLAEELDLTFVDECVGVIGRTEDKVLAILQAMQDHYGYLPESAMERVCEITDITPASIMGIGTFYDQFRHTPAGKHIVRVCVGTACHVKGAQDVYNAFLRHLDIPEGEDTDVKREFTIEKIACLGCCTLAPAMQIGDVTYGHLTAETVGGVLEDYLRYEQQSRKGKEAAKKHRGRKDRDVRGEIRIGLGSCCQARGSGKLNEAVEKALAETGINARLKHVGCVGMCYQTPLLEVVLPDGVSYLYAKVNPEDARAILLRHFKVRGVGRKIAGSISNALDTIVTGRDGEAAVQRHSVDVRDGHVADFLGRQKNIATEHCGNISPVDIDEYLSYGGFDGLKKVVGMSNEEVIGELEKSGLRGRGGAGFPTYLKWKTLCSQEDRTRYVVCNGDEGDPGAFMDRMLMESYPLRVIEGVTIAARTVGATHGYLYIRAEYPLALRRMTEAIAACRKRGFLGDDILGGGWGVDLQIVAGAGAFVCGEETALLSSIMGRRGMPWLRPPYPTKQGLWGKPTLINNVETYAQVSWIMRNGGSAFAAMGTEKSRGTKVFALAGKIARGGLIEVPMGVTIRQIVQDIGGGIEKGLGFKAVQVGGPSGGCVPAALSDIPVDYESLTEAGAIMGSGGLVVLDESDCMVEISRYFLEFTQNQSCGKCTFCRVGTRRMLDVLERLCSGRGEEGDIERLEHLSRMVKASSLCGLGKTAPNPVLSTIKHFRDEYEAHIQGRCPAGRCKAMVTYSINDQCIGCTICAQHCPVDAIAMVPYQKHQIDNDKCTRCGVCKNVCPAEAVEVK